MSISEKIENLTAIKAFVLAIFCGLLTALALAPLHFLPIVFATIPVLVWLLTACPTYKRAFFIGWGFGFGYFLGGLWWIANSLLVEAELFAWGLPFALFGLPSILAIYWGLGAVITKKFALANWHRILTFALFFAIMEYLRAKLFSGFGWNMFGYVFLPETITMQITNIIGISGVTFFAFFIAAAPAILAKNKTVTPRRARAVLTSAFALFALQIIYGIASLNFSTNEKGETIKIKIVQPNISQKDKLNPNKKLEIFLKYIKLSRDNINEFDYLIWPESALPFLLEQENIALAEIDKMLNGKTKLITGAVRITNQNNKHKIFNSVLVLDSQANIIATSDKIRLVPFGEFLPFRFLLEKIGLQTITRTTSDFAKGQRNIIENGNNPPFVALICYEIIFSGEKYDNNINWLVNLTNDAWFGNSSGPHQHAHQALVRGVEMGLPVVRVANTGISFISDGKGRIKQKIPLNKQGTIEAKLPVAQIAIAGAGAKKMTIFSQFNDVIFAIISCIAFFIVIFTRINHFNFVGSERSKNEK